ncbi:MAG: TolC family protein [Spirochaetia bacterium]|nr:TolC family protein [Spirochaetia bacterium]
MNYSLRRIMTILLLGSALVSVPALSLESIEEYTSYVLQQDLSLSGVQIDITSARNDLEEPSLLEASTLSVDSGYSYTGTGSIWRGTLGASLPLSDALQLSGSVTGSIDSGYALSGSLGLDFKPFTHSVTDELAQNSYEQLTVQQAGTISSVSLTAVEHLLAWRTAQRAYELSAAAASVYEQTYLDQKVRYELGEASLDEVRSALLSWSTANRQTLTAQTTLQQAQQQMYLLLGGEVTEFTLPDPDAEALQQLISQVEDSGMLETVSPSGSSSVQAAQYTAQRARITYEDIRAYDPDLKISTAAAYNNDSIGASVSFSLSAQDFNSEQKQQAYDQLILAERTAAQQYDSTLFAIENLKSSLISTAAQLEIIKLEIEQAESLQEESALLYELGTLSATELEQSRNDLLQSEHQYYSTLADRYLIILQLRAYTGR